MKNYMLLSSIIFFFCTENFAQNIGIGTTTPAAKLHIADNSYPSLALESSSQFGSWLALGNSGGGSWFHIISTGSGNGSGADKLLFMQGTSLTSTSLNIMTFDHATANIGLGTYFPKNKLDVGGAMVVGAAYSGNNTAPQNGLLVQGNAGIGKNNPSFKLDVLDDNPANSTVASFNTSGTTGQILVSNIYSTALLGADEYGVYAGAANSTDFRLTSGGLTRVMVKEGTGNVGIGILYPSSKLDVFHSTANSTVANFASVNGFAQIHVTNSVDTAQMGMDANGMFIGSLDNADFRIRTKATDRFFIKDGTGNAGIGTNAPASKLDVRTTAGSVTVANFSSPGGWGQIHVSNSVDTAQVGVDGAGMYIGTLDNADVRIRTNSRYRMVIKDGTGFTGIGTNVPAYKLDVRDSLGNTAVAGFSAAGTSGEIRVGIQSKTALLGVDNFGGYTGMANDEDFRISLGNIIRLTVKGGTGNVGIGTNIAVEKLVINGAIKIADAGYAIPVAGLPAPVPAGGAGTIVFATGHFYGWNGTVWKQLDN